MSFLSVVSIILGVLKLLEMIDISWWVVVAPAVFETIFGVIFLVAVKKWFK